MQCIACHKTALEGEKFCSQCGGKLTEAMNASRLRVDMTLAQRLQPVFLLFIALVLTMLVVQNFFLLSSLKQLLSSVTIAAAPEGMSLTDGQAHGEHDDVVMPTSDDSAMIFAALMTPCGKCNRPLMDNNCLHANGANATKALINKMFQEGKTKREVVAYFIDKYGKDILTPQAQAIYKQVHSGQKPGQS